jgi:hypothetical protein
MMLSTRLVGHEPRGLAASGQYAFIAVGEAALEV